MSIFLQQLFATQNGQSGMLMSMILLCTLSIIGFEAYSVIWLHAAFDALTFASGCAALLAGGGSGLGFHYNLRATRNGVVTGTAAAQGGDQ